MSIWEFIGFTLTKMVNFFDEIVLFFGISMMEIIIFTVAILDLTAIIKSIFQTKGGDD